MKRQHYPCNVLGFRCSGLDAYVPAICKNNAAHRVDLLRIRSGSEFHGILPMPYPPGGKK